MMYFCHDRAIWQQFPQLVPGVLLADRIDPQVDVTPYLEPWYERARARLRETSESGLPEVAAWRRAYAQMGLKPTQYRSAAEALMRRFRQEDALPRLHPLVDLCNAMSLAFALPVAVFDLDGIAELLEVRHAMGDEQYLAFSGEIETPTAGEVVFVDAAKQIHARRWTFRQSRRSTVRPETNRVLIVSEGLHTTAAADVLALLDGLAVALGTLWFQPVQRAILTANAPRFEFATPEASRQ